MRFQYYAHVGDDGGVNIGNRGEHEGRAIYCLEVQRGSGGPPIYGRVEGPEAFMVAMAHMILEAFRAVPPQRVELVHVAAPPGRRVRKKKISAERAELEAIKEGLRRGK